MTLTCYVLDDDDHAVNAVVKHIEKIPELTCVGKNTDPIIALREIKLKTPNIVFLDIEMPELSGIQVAGLLPEGTFIVFITSHSKYAIEAIEKHAVGYLLKPFSFHMFVTCVNKIRDRILKSESPKLDTSIDKLFINSGSKGKITSIAFAEILYIEALDNSICIFTHNNSYKSRVGIKSIEVTLPTKNFARIHRSYIVNIDHIISIENNIVTMSSNALFPFGESYKSKFMAKIGLGAMRNKNAKN